jgi:GNAT superfamily N-acetyltransferase
MEERIRKLNGDQGHVVYVACDGNDVIGWIDAGIMFHLQSGAYGEIGGLVMSSVRRSAGVGSQLMVRAEKWFRERAVTRVVVRSQIVREAAHRFYLRAGYERTKTSAVFSKTLT